VGDHVIDTNVLLVASAGHPGSPFIESNVPPEQQRIVLDWLMAFRTDRRRNVVLDGLWKIWKEYHHKMTGQDIGLLVVTEKLQSVSVRTVDILYDKHGHGCLPKELEKVVHDRADRKLVAVAMAYMATEGECNIVNACDSDWYDWEEALEQAGVVVEQLIDKWCRPRWKKKHKR
jgi:hypothetical protein